MILRKCIFTNNDCYKKATPITPKGIVVHSTGANNPNLKRYVQPDDGLLGDNKYNNDWNRSGVGKCVHGFIGKDKNGDVQVYQTLPFNYAAWGVGNGKKGSYNYNPTGYIQFEICEDGLTDANYFNKAFDLAAEFCAYLIKEYNLSLDNVVSHNEAYKRGYASNHNDCDHWLKNFGKDMNWFRSLVKSKMEDTKPAPTPEPTKTTIKYVYNCTDLNEKTGPGTGYEAVNTLVCKTAVKFYETKGSWARIEKGMWVSNKYLTSKAPSGHIKSMEVTKCKELNVRKTPNGAIVDKLPENCVVSVLETKGSWVRIGKNRWVYSQYLK